MSLLLLRTYPDPVLRVPAGEVDVFDDRLVELVRELTRQMHAHGGVGLAAPQLGVSRRVIVFRDADGRDRHLVNPRLLDRSDTVADAEEGCLSLPGVFASLPRPTAVVAVGFDVDGGPVGVDASGLTARCVQHEIDHLDGVLFIDRLDWRHRARLLAAYRERFGVDPATAPAPRHHR